MFQIKGGTKKGRGTAITKLLRILVNMNDFAYGVYVKAITLVYLKHTSYLFWLLPYLCVLKEIHSLSLQKCAKKVALGPLDQGSE